MSESPPHVEDPEGPTGRVAGLAFALTVLSMLVYFSTSIGIRRFIAFLVDGVVRVAKLLGWAA